MIHTPPNTTSATPHMTAMASQRRRQIARNAIRASSTIWFTGVHPTLHARASPVLEPALRHDDDVARRDRGVRADVAALEEILQAHGVGRVVAYQDGNSAVLKSVR